MHPICYDLPPEILESSIDDLGRQRNCFDSQRALQTCCFVSRSFRNRAHHHLFSEIKFTPPPYCTEFNSFQEFRRIVCSGLKLPMTSLLYHIRSFKLVVGNCGGEVHGILVDKDLVEIMQLLMRHSQHIHTFAMRGLAESYPFVWTNLTLDFRVAFKALCQSSTNLTTLYLENMAGVPHTLLTGTHIKHLRFHLIHLARSNTAFIPFPEDHFPKGQLESIDIDYSFPFPFPTQDLIEKDIHHRESVSHRQPLFSHVKRLKYILRPCDDLQKFVVVARGISSSLEVVYLQLSGTDLKASSPEIPFEELHNLRCMIIRHKSVVCALTRHPLIKVAAILRNLGVPPSLDSIEIAFEVFSQPPWLKLTHFFPEPKTWALLDAALNHERFASVHNITFRLQYYALQAQPWAFDERIFIERCHGFLMDAFPLLSSSGSKTLDMVVSVDVCPG